MDAARWAVVVIALALAAVTWAWAARPIAKDKTQPRDTGYRVDVNHAGVAELTLVPGIGPNIAEAIVRHREVHGAFTEMSQLEAVPRIGPKTRAGMERYIQLGRETYEAGDYETEQD